MTTLHLSSEPEGDTALVDRFQDAIDESNMRITGARDYSPVKIFLRDESGAAHGCLVAHLWGGWMHIVLVWIEERLRGQGYGTQLLLAAEAEARARGCKGAHLETFSFQGRPFYERFGYRVFGEVEDYPPGQTQFYMKKRWD
jgi:GNAT superfamily N-acetyltransferase